MTHPAIRAATPEAIVEAAALIRSGSPVAFPTETVYGLGADATNDEAVAAVFAAKDRPRFNPLIVHCRDAATAARLAVFDKRARKLADAFWPGPLTLVLPRRAESGLSLLVSAGLETVAVRVPDHAVAQALLDAADRPLAAPSANASGAISPTTAQHVAASLEGRVDLILDGGPCPVGVESTVVDFSGPDVLILRLGGVDRDAIEAIAGPFAPIGEGPIRSPGMLERHYAPGMPLRMDANEVRTGEVLLAFGPDAPADAPNLSPRGDVREAAANLFAQLHALDRPEHAGIAVMPIPESGLGAAINDRLRRAAAASASSGNDWDDRGPSAPCVLPDMDDTTT